MNFFDFYGTPYNLNILGKRTLKTKLSLFSSFITLAVLGITTYLIGKDFFFSTNPKVLTGMVIPEASEAVYLNNSNFTVAFTLEDIGQNPIAEEEKMAFPYVLYSISERTENNEVETKMFQLQAAKPCLEVEGVSTAGLEKFDLNNLFCVDFNEMRDSLGLDTDLPVYGQLEDNFISSFSLFFSNCKPDSTSEDFFSECLSYEELTRRSAKDQYASVYMPRYSFDPENYSAPFGNYYENIYLKLSPFTEYSEAAYYSTITLSDDKGWIFEDIDSVLVFDLERRDKTPKFLQAEAFQAKQQQTLFELTLFFQRKRIILSRSYIKIQELAANLGGIMKVLFTFCTVLNKFYASFKFEVAMVSKHFTPQTVNIENPSQSVSRVGSISLQTGININLFQYLKIKLGLKEKLRREATALDSIKNSLDLENILRIEKQLAPKKPQEASQRESVRSCVIRNN